MSPDETQFRDVHGYLIRDLQTICDYEHDDLDDLKRVCLACQTQLQTDGDSITVGQIEILYNDLATAKTQWTEKVGIPKMKYYSDGGLYTYGSSGYRLEEGVRNKEIYDVKTELDGCLEKLLNMKKILSRIQAKGPPSFIPTPDSTIRPPDDDMPLYPWNSHPTHIHTPVSTLRTPHDEMPERSHNSFELERVRKTHTFPRNTNIQSVEYGEVQKEGFTQIYANGALGCIVTWRNGNDEVILWPDYHTEIWIDGKFQSMQYASVEYRYSSPEGRAKWAQMWEKDKELYQSATEFYLEDNAASMPKTDTWHPGKWDGTPKNKMHTADVQTLLHRMKKIYI